MDMRRVKILNELTAVEPKIVAAKRALSTIEADGLQHDEAWTKLHTERQATLRKLQARKNLLTAADEVLELEAHKAKFKTWQEQINRLRERASFKARCAQLAEILNKRPDDPYVMDVIRQSNWRKDIATYRGAVRQYDEVFAKASRWAHGRYFSLEAFKLPEVPHDDEAF